VETSPPASSFLARNEFLIRRLHSLSGLIPVGAYMVVHLLTNASVNVSNITFQKLVVSIHGLGPVLLPIVEWVFIFLPILFHAILGVWIIREGQPNHNSYRYTNNVRYSLQRATGMIAFVFIMYHVFHMHGWFHFEPWFSTAQDLGGAQFRAYNAASTAARALQGNIIINIIYTVGILSCVFHLANGLWTMGITWGLWVTPSAQRWANYFAAGFGIFLAVVGLSAQFKLLTIDPAAARIEEDKYYEAGVATGEIVPDDHKRYHEENEDFANGSSATKADAEREDK
jgi:succinate dehydrogenase / fumarate reductase cytochrome b subunit